jgi:TolB-like protein
MRALCLSLIFMSFGCASILRSKTHDVTIYGPQDLQAFNGSARVELQNQGPGPEDGQTKYVAYLDKDTPEITLRTAHRTATAHLDTHVAAGWVVLDFLIVWPISLPVDYVNQAWRSFNDITFATAGAPPQQQAQAAPPPSRAPPPQQQQTYAQAPAAGRPILDRGKLAVLDFQNFAKDLSKEDVHYFADVVRGATLKTSPGMEVMTRENLLVLLQATGKDASNCEGECEVDTGRRIGADAVISGEVLKVGSRYKISLKLHETHEGRLLSTGVASGKSIDELDEKLQQAASDLLAPR